MKRLSRFASLILLASLGLHVGTALAQTYPRRPIRIVVPYPPGGNLDATARLIGPKMADALNQPVVVENRPGASAHIGQDLVAKAAPDGHTMLVDAGGLAVSPALYRNLPFNAARDFVPVTQLVISPLVLVAGSKLQAASTSDLIALAKSRPGGLNYGHTGVGNPLHLAMELFKLRAGIDIVAIPYKGDAPISVALMAGEVDVAIVPLSSNLQSMRAGRMRALSVAGARRSPALPDVPTATEAGVAGYEYAGVHEMFMPAKTPRDIVALIQREAVKALNMPDVRDRLLAMGLEIVGSTPEEFAAKYRADLEKYVRIVAEARIPLQN